MVLFQRFVSISFLFLLLFDGGGSVLYRINLGDDNDVDGGDWCRCSITYFIRYMMMVVVVPADSSLIQILKMKYEWFIHVAGLV